MSDRLPIPPRRPPALLRALILSSCLALAAPCGPGVSPGIAAAQEPHPRPFRLDGLYPYNLRTTVTEGWVALDFSVTNFTDDDRTARVLVFYPEARNVQYGRDVWVPAHATASSRLLIGPAVAQERQLSRNFEFLLYDRSGGQDRLLLPPDEEHVRARPVSYKPRIPYTAVLLDRPDLSERTPGALPQPEPADYEVVRLARVFRLDREVSEDVQQAKYVRTLDVDSLPSLAEAYDAVDHVVLASGQLAQRPVALRALRHWLEQGGTVWVLLDRVEPDAVAPLLGEALDFHVVDRVSLNRFQIWPLDGVPDLPQEHERPVTFARVLLPAGEQAKYNIGGWPVWFTRTVGRGKVVFSTLGPRGLYRRRKDDEDPASLPLPVVATKDLAAALQPNKKEEPLRVEVFRNQLSREIGYAVIGRNTVALVSGGFLLVGLAVGLALRNARRRELLGFLGPAGALGATAVLFALGVSSRHASPPTVAVGQIVETLPGAEEVPVRSLVAVYQADAGPVEVAARHGGMLELDTSGSDDRTRRFLVTDLDARHWEDLSLPAGVRFGSFRTMVPIAEPLTAVARYGPEGLEGELKPGTFGRLEDLLLDSQNARRLSIRLRADGSFRAGPREVLPPGHFVASAVLDDQQQQRQEILRQALKRPVIVRTAARPTLMAWAPPIDTGLELTPQDRVIGGALLVVPLHLERSDPDTRVLIPGPLVPGARLQPTLGPRGGFRKQSRTVIPPTLPTDADLHLRFQLPAEVLPLRVERARLLARIHAPGRQVAIRGRADGKLVPLRAINNPTDPIRLDITDERLLRLDEEGGLHLDVSITTTTKEKEEVGSKRSEPWKIDYIELEVAGHTAPEDKG